MKAGGTFGSYRLGSDACGDWFVTALNAANPDLNMAGRLLDIGCAEFAWLEQAGACWPGMERHGIDWRKSVQSGATIQRGDVRNPDAYAPETFDTIVSLSAIEHIGLGHYDHDPVDADGDVVAVANAVRWLKPGGWLYFDVPFSPTGYSVEGTSHRIYDAEAFRARFPLSGLTEVWRGWSPAGEPLRLLETEPTEPIYPFYVMGVWLTKS